MQSLWWKKSRGTPNTGAGFRGQGKPSKCKGRGWLPTENILSRHFEKYLHDMDLKLTEHVRNTISLLYKQKLGKILIFGTFLAKKSILAYISLKIYIFRSAMFYYAILTSYIDLFSWFWYKWKEETLPFIMVPNNYTLWACQFQVHTGNHPPQEDVLQKWLRKTRFKFELKQ